MIFFFFFLSPIKAAAFKPYQNPERNVLSLRSISSHLLTSLTNFRWNTFTSGLSCRERQDTLRTPTGTQPRPKAPGPEHPGSEGRLPLPAPASSPAAPAAAGAGPGRGREVAAAAAVPGCAKRGAAGTHVAELDLPQLAQLADTAVRGLGLEEELGQGHLLAAEQLPHGGDVPAAVSEEKGREDGTRAAAGRRGARTGPALPAPSRPRPRLPGGRRAPSPARPRSAAAPAPPCYLPPQSPRSPNPQRPPPADPRRLPSLTSLRTRGCVTRARLLATARLGWARTGSDGGGAGGGRPSHPAPGRSGPVFSEGLVTSPARC